MTDTTTAVASEDPDDHADSTAHLRGSTLLLLGRLISIAINLVSQALIARHLSQTAFGAFALAFAIAGLGQVFITLGMHRGATQFFSRYLEERAYPRLIGTILFNGAVIVGLGAALVLLIALAQGILTSGGLLDPTATVVLLILVILAPIDALDDMLIALFAVFGSPRSIFIRRYVLGPGLRLAVAAILVLANGDALQLAIGYLLAAIFGLLLYGALFVRMLQRRGVLHGLRGTPPEIPAREILRFSLPLLSNDGVWLLINTLPIVVLTAASGLAEVAAFQVVKPAAALNMLVANSFYVLYLPAASRLAGRADIGRSRELYWRTAIWVAVISFPIFALTFALGRPLTELLFGERYAASGLYLSILSVGYYVSASLGHNAPTLAAHGHTRSVALLNGGAAVAGVVAALILIPPFGAIGAAVAASGTLILQTGLLQLALRPLIGIPPIDREALRVFGIVGIAAALLIVIETSGSIGWLSIPATGLVSLVVLFVCRDALRIDTMFPEVGVIVRRVLDVVDRLRGREPRIETPSDPPAP